MTPAPFARLAERSGQYRRRGGGERSASRANGAGVMVARGDDPAGKRRLLSSGVIAARDHDACTVCPARGTLAAAAPSILAWRRPALGLFLLLLGPLMWFGIVYLGSLLTLLWQAITRVRTIMS
jgi:hypothetical protein